MSDDDWIRVSVPGKINLALKVGGVDDDGYHPLATVFQAVSIHDEVSVRWAPGGVFSVTCSGEQAHLVPTDQSNLAVRAARLLTLTHGSPDRHGCEIHIRKSIPVTGGVAQSGSSNAAGALLACSVLWDSTSLSTSSSVSDASLAPTCPSGSSGRTLWVPDAVTCWCPCSARRPPLGSGAVGVPALDAGSVPHVRPAHPRRATPEVPVAVLEALASGDPAAIGAALVGDLEAPAIALRPALRPLLDAGLELGALGSLLSGSGPTVAFLAASESAAIDLSVGLSSLGGQCPRRSGGCRVLFPGRDCKVGHDRGQER